jgi:opacity protein-like surface antigen
MNSKLLASAAVAGLLAAAPAEAEGLYIGAFGGVNFLDEATGSADAPSPSAPPGVGYAVEVENDTGWAAGGAIGYGFDFGLRAEAEVAYRWNDLDRAKVVTTAIDLEGDTTALSVMGNLWFDVPLTGRVRPFLGGGIGMAQVSLNDVEVSVLAPGTTFVDDSDWVFAYQVGGGVAFQVAPGVDLTAEYRYFGTDDPEYELEAVPLDAEYEYSSHSVMFGLRYSFNPS